MDTLELIARLALAAVFAVAALAKLADRPGSQQALSAFGMPELLARPGSVLLPLAELAVAVLLIPAGTATLGAAGALALLLAFCAGIARSMARGESPDCHCFGQLHSEPVGWSTLARNAGLAALAGFALATSLDGETESALGWLGDLSGPALAAIGGGLALVTLLGAASTFVFQLLRQHGRVLLRLDALEQALTRAGIVLDSLEAPAAPDDGSLPVGSSAPEFTLPGVHGDTTTLEALLAAEKPLLLLFTDPGCGPCTALLPQVAAWQRDQGNELTIALIARGNAKDIRAKAKEHGVDHVFIESGTEVSELYGTIPTPSAVVVNPDGAIGSPPAAGEPAIRALVVATLASAQLEVIAAGSGNGGSGDRPIDVVARGDAVPETSLQSLDGDPVSLPDALAQRTLLLFWNPGCGFCRQMLEELHGWEREPPEGAPALLLISAGSAAANRAQGLRSPILLDQGFRAASAFGAGGTPSAVLIDADGRVASEVGVGAPACMALARDQALESNPG